MRIESKNNQVAWGAGKREFPSRDWCNFYIWWAERVVQFSGPIIEQIKAKPMQSRDTFDTKLKSTPKDR